MRLTKIALLTVTGCASMSTAALASLPELGADIRVDTDLSKFDNTRSSYIASNIAFRFEGKNVTLDPKDGALNFESARRGIAIYSAKDKAIPSHLVIGTKDTQDVTVKVSTNTTINSDSVGIVLLRLHANPSGTNSSANDVGVPTGEVNGKNLSVFVHNDGTGEVRGINVQNNTTSSDQFATLVLNSENTVVNVTGQGMTVGLSAMSQGRIIVNGNLEVNAQKAIIARGDAVVIVNKNADKTVKLNGDIDFTYNESTSGTKVDAIVDVTLSGVDSYWVGNASTSSTSGTPPEGYDEVHGLMMKIKNQAHWTPTLLMDTDKRREIAINNMQLDDGVINLTEAVVSNNQSVKIESLEGKGGTISSFVKASTDGSISSGKIEVGKLKNTAHFNVVASNLTSDDVINSQVQKTLGALGSTLNINSSSDADNTTIKTVVEEGDINGALTQEFSVDGLAKGDVEKGVNQKLDGYSSIAVLSAVQWRHENDTLLKRMGELRDADGTVGAWARIYGSEQEYGAQSVKAKNTTIQVGSDYDIGAGWKVGGAFSYTDGSSTFDRGQSDNKMYGLSLYGTYLADNGLFVDLIGKYSRLTNDFTSGTMKGDFDNNAFSIAAETGWHYAFNTLGFVEPSFGVTYGRIMGDDFVADNFVADNGVKVEQDDYDSLIGRVGVRGGFYFPEQKGNIYARLAVLHDFMDDMEATASKYNKVTGLNTSHLKEELGDTWIEYGIGANFKLAKNAYTFVDLEKTAGSDVKENWKWTIGARYAF